MRDSNPVGRETVEFAGEAAPLRVRIRPAAFRNGHLGGERYIDCYEALYSDEADSWGYFRVGDKPGVK
jgi:hypothetical protein